MSLDAEIRSTAKVAASADSYDRIAKAVHWTTLLLIAGVYVTVWTSHAVGSREQSALVVQLHRSIGVTIFALTLFRLTWRGIARIPPLPAELPLFQRVAARTTEYVLYLLLLLQPALGLLNTNARGGESTSTFSASYRRWSAPTKYSPNRRCGRTSSAPTSLRRLLPCMRPPRCFTTLSAATTC
jgi:cytochrome b561